MNKIWCQLYIILVLIITFGDGGDIDLEDTEEEVVNLLREKDVVASQEMSSWSEARIKCEESKLTLLILDSQENNKFLNLAPFLKRKPFSTITSFWSAGRFTSPEYTKLFWETADGKKEVKKFMNDNFNGIRKSWAIGEPKDDSRVGNDLCVDITFPKFSPPIWAASDCNEKKYFICIRPSNLRNEEDPVKLSKSNDNIVKHNSLSRVISKPNARSFAKLSIVPDYGDGPVEGIFIFDANPRKFVKGTIQPGSPLLFTPEDPTKLISKATAGTFKPEYSTSAQYPFLTFQGMMKPYPAVNDSSIFLIEPAVIGEFIPDKGKEIIPGKMAQDTSIFTPDFGPFITRPTLGSWVPSPGSLPVYPCKIIHGTLKPDSEKTAKFTPAPLLYGLFIPDSSKKPIRGGLGQENPPQFFPSSNIDFSKPQSGTWKPNRLNFPAAIAHGVMMLITEPVEKIIFTPNEEVPGKFITESDPDNLIDGFMTTSTENRVFTPNEEIDLRKPIIGTWAPSSSSNSIQGILKPSENLPPNSAYFKPNAKIDDVAGLVAGQFYLDDISKKPIFAKLSSEAPYSFFPDQNSTEDFSTALSYGTWVPAKAENPSDPYTAIHGVVDKGVFTPDETVDGTFIPDYNQADIPGSMHMEYRPKLFVPTDPEDGILIAMSGRWRPTEGNSHFLSIRGVMRPSSTGGQGSSNFVPDLKVEGEFKILGKDHLFSGAMSQGFPAIFSPQYPIDASGELFGSWRPLVGVTAIHPFTCVQGILKEIPESTPFTQFYIFTTFERTTGTFSPDDPSRNDIKGTALLTNPIKFTANNPADMYKQPTSGTWKPSEAFVPSDPLYYSHGILQPSKRKTESAVITTDNVMSGKFLPDGANVTSTIYGTMTRGTTPVFKPDIGDNPISEVLTGIWTPHLLRNSRALPTPVRGSLKPSETKSLPSHYAYFIAESKDI